MVNGVSSSNVSTKKYESKKRNVIANAIGITAGLALPAYQIYDTFQKVTPNAAQDISKSMYSFIPDCIDLDKAKDAAQKIMKDTALKDKGVELLFINENKPETINKLKEIMDAAIPPTKKAGKRLNNNFFNIFKEGANAAYIEGGNKKAVLVSDKQFYSNVFHEIGHAMDANKGFLTRTLVKARGITPYGASLVAPIALGVALMHKVDDKKPKEEKGFVEKSLDFISKHAVGLTALSYLPMTMEEGLASIRGLKQAKKYLPKEDVTKLAVNYAKAWSTYGILAAGSVLGVAAGIGIAKHIKAKNNNSQNA